jgi:hypothetical protein
MCWSKRSEETGIKAYEYGCTSTLEMEKKLASKDAVLRVGFPNGGREEVDDRERR